MGDGDQDNPFRLPPDDQIFLIREQERQKRAEDRDRVKQLRVWEKTTASSRVHKNRRVDDDIDEAALAAETAKHGRSTRGESVGRDPRREKENVSDFVAKKREMFLVQMSLDVKKAEILKLDEKAKQKEEALKKSQQMLDDDVTRFDNFLQNNDQKAHKAMKDAEEETKKKQDRLQRIKQLKSQLSAIQSESAKHREQLEECLKFKSFLEKLTPQEWKDQKMAEKRERKSSRKLAFIEERMSDVNAKIAAEIEIEEKRMEDKAQDALKGRRRARREAEQEAEEREREMERRKRAIRRKYPTQETVEAEYVEVSSGEEIPMFFEKPKQLLDVFTSLEEQNLFLIQTSQDTEQMLEEIQQKLVEKKKTMGHQTLKLQQNISQLQGVIKEDQDKSEYIRHMLSQKRGASEQDQLLAELAEGVMEVHGACGHDSEQNPDSLQMLGNIEKKLEDYLTQLDDAEENGLSKVVFDESSRKEKARRDDVRKQRKEQQDKKIEDRLKASLQRSMQPIHKKVGKQIMFRSPPLFQARRVVQEDDGYEEAVKEHHVFSIWIDKDGIPREKQPEKPN
mmetsp:Transcript_1361/g.2407  ORF Transcript_1361/g.2407 Transcript_1361/m.2407 type:complete len:565 (-) Transcript_1361:80-1774(-)